MDPESMLLIPSIIVDGKAIPQIPICNPDGSIKQFFSVSDVCGYALRNNIFHYDIVAVLHPEEY